MVATIGKLVVGITSIIGYGVFAFVAQEAYTTTSAVDVIAGEAGVTHAEIPVGDKVVTRQAQHAQRISGRVAYVGGGNEFVGVGEAGSRAPTESGIISTDNRKEHCGTRCAKINLRINIDGNATILRGSYSPTQQ